ncbi:MAG: ABC transporter substrate-binding protein [Acidimicrobiia bacterium]
MAAPQPRPTPQGSFPVNGRLLRGYGPLAVFAVMLVLMALLVPTKVPDQQVSSSDGTAPSAGQGFATTPGGGASGTDSGSSGGATPVTAGGGGGGDQAAPSGGGGGGVGSDGEGSGIAPVEGVQPCPDRAEQIPGDPYSPPCVAWAGGNNGGATTKGVTEDSILVSYRVLGEKGFQQTLAELAGASLSDTPQSIQNTITAFAEYFNQRFELYGRQIEIQFYEGQGSNTNELLGKGRDRAEADATKVAEEIGAFADISATSEPYAGALASRGVIGFGTPYLSREWHEQRAPFAWSLATDGTRVSELAAEYGNKRLHGKPAAYAGGDLKGQPRKFATIAPENSWYQESVNNARRITEEAGNDPGLNVKYQLDLSTMSSQANNIIPKLKNEGVTSIVCGCDPVLPVFLSGVANREQYYPEFLIVGTALTDADIVGQLWEPQFAQHAFGVSSLTDFVPPTQTIAYEAFKSVRPNEEPAFSVDLIYYQMYMLAIGLQGAGPNLTPQSFSDGMFNYPARQGPVGLWKFGPGDRTAANDVREIYFDINAISTYNGKQGAYLGTSGERWEAGQIPAGDPGVPPVEAR